MALVQKQFSDLITFTRASGGGRFNASGKYEWLADNVPRIDYDPITGVCLGILIEEQRTNLLLNSATLATQSLNLTAGTYTLSFYGSGTVSLSGAYSGTVVGSGSSTRTTFSFTATAGTLTLTVSGSCTSGQLEAGTFPTSYIPTTTAQVTRAADIPAVNTLSPWYNHSEWAIVVEFDVIADAPANQFVASLGSTIASTDWFLSGSSAAGQVATNYMNSAYIAASPVARSRKVAVAYSAAGLAMSLNGGAVMSDATVTPMSSTPTKLNLGYAASPGGPLNGHIKSFRYYPKRQANLQELTA